MVGNGSRTGFKESQAYSYWYTLLATYLKQVTLLMEPDAWKAFLELTQTPWGHTFLILVIGASTFHSANGVRLIFTHFGVGLGMPGRPDYPYSAASLNYKQKSGIWIALILAAVAMLYGMSVLFGQE